MSKKKQTGLVRLTGVIADYKVMRAGASFVFTDGDCNALGVVAVAAAIAGLSGAAISTAANATNAEEDADYVEFNLGGNAVRGWVWRSPFKEGDEVEVAADRRADYYEVAGIARPLDRIVALYPHCSRGRVRHIKNAVKWWFVGTTLLFILVLLFMSMMIPVDHIFQNEEGEAYVYFGAYLFFGLMTFSLSRKWMPFVRLAEKVFTTLGWPNPRSIDLVQSTKARREPNDPGELGTFYFRY